MISVSDLTKVIGRTTVLDGVTAEFRNGAITGLQGINGSGKTMLIRALAGLIKPTKGVVAIDGQRLWKDIALPPSIGALIENPSFLDAYTGFANLKMLASFKKCASDSDIRAALQAVGLDPDDKRKYRKYSLGMKQRLGIAAAVMEKPDIVLLDEPTNALDESGLSMLRELVSKQKSRGAVVVIASHDRRFLLSLADELYEFSGGRVVGHKRRCDGRSRQSRPCTEGDGSPMGAKRAEDEGHVDASSLDKIGKHVEGRERFSHA